MSNIVTERLLSRGADLPGPKHLRPRGFVALVMGRAMVRWSARIGAIWILLVAFCAIFAPFLANSAPFILKSEGKLSFPLFGSLHPIDLILPVGAMVGTILLIRRRIGFSSSLALLLWACALTGAAACWPSSADYLQQMSSLVGPAGGMGLLIGFWILLAAIVILFPLLIPRKAILITGGCLLPLLIWLLIFPVRPPKTIVYEQYRDLARAGNIQFALYAPLPFSPSDRLRDLGDASFLSPSRIHPMGTEYAGADVCSRMIHACRIALAIGLISTGIARLIGVLVGGMMGYFAGKTDIFGMRLIEIFEAIPTLFLLITFVAFYGRNLYAMMVIIGITGWTSTARFIRAEFLKLRKQDFVQAAIASGLPLRRVLFGHMLPNGITPVLVTTSFGIAAAILYESTLSFLGLGLIDQPSWGQMLNQARGVGASFIWWIAIYPGLAIFLTVLAYNLIGEALRDAIDPHLNR
ncbi:MAG: ABC transporter permease [Phycisphaerales bacterium]|nr:ABC transporter permease [Phycisphaerales bacterium]